MFKKVNRKRYVKAMLKAIDSARQSVKAGENKQTKTNGLRVIKRFERVNKCKFDPFNEYHVNLIYGNAKHESFFRKAGYVFKGIKS